MQVSSSQVSSSSLFSTRICLFCLLTDRGVKRARHQSGRLVGNSSPAVDGYAYLPFQALPGFCFALTLFDTLLNAFDRELGICIHRRHVLTFEPEPLFAEAFWCCKAPLLQAARACVCARQACDPRVQTGVAAVRRG